MLRFALDVNEYVRLYPLRGVHWRSLFRYLFALERWRTERGEGCMSLATFWGWDTRRASKGWKFNDLVPVRVPETKFWLFHTVCYFLGLPQYLLGFEIDLYHAFRVPWKFLTPTEKLRVFPGLVYLFSKEDLSTGNRILLGGFKAVILFTQS